MQITPNSLESNAGPGDSSTGAVYIVSAPHPWSHRRLARPAYTSLLAPRTAWHMHPLGQTILVTEGLGRCRREGGRSRNGPGDRVFFEPGGNHWHGAAPTASWPTSLCSRLTTRANAVTWGDTSPTPSTWPAPAYSGRGRPPVPPLRI